MMLNKKDNTFKNTGIIFDMDGVLVDSEPVIKAAAIKGLSEYGVNAEPKDFDPFIGAGEDRFIGGVANKYGMDYKLEMKHRVYEIYLDLVSDNLKIYEGIPEMIKRLKGKGYRLALASSADLIKVKANLKTADISFGLFDSVLTGEDVKNKKPAPDVFLKAAQQMGIVPKRCYVVEDAVNGIRAAKAANMKSIGITSTFSYNELKVENPDYIFSNTAEIESIF